MTRKETFAAHCDALGLDAGTRSTLRRVLVEGVPPAQAAREFGLRLGTLQTALRRYRKRVLAEEEPPPPGPPVASDAPWALLSWRQRAVMLLDAMRGPSASRGAILDPEEGDRDAVHGRALCVEDVETLLRNWWALKG